MQDWRFWDWVAYAALFMATGLEALEAGLRQAPKVASHMPDIFLAEWLSFVPFALVCAATVILVSRVVTHRFHPAGGPTKMDQDARGMVPSGPHLNPPGDFEWLSDAAQMVYGNLGKCRVRDMVEARGKDDNGIVNVTARMIATYADLYGCRAPSKVRSTIEHDEIDRLDINAYGTILVDPNSNRIIWTDLLVRRDDLARATAAIMNIRHSSVADIR
jgi:hypothetical protein